MEVLEKKVSGKIEFDYSFLDDVECFAVQEECITEEEFRKCIEEAERNGEISAAKAERFLMVFKAEVNF
jgi:hypothetical protein